MVIVACVGGGGFVWQWAEPAFEFLRETFCERRRSKIKVAAQVRDGHRPPLHLHTFVSHPPPPLFFCFFF